MNKIYEFILYYFYRKRIANKINDSADVKINKVDVESGDEVDQSVKIKIILIVNWLLAVVCLLSFLMIIYITLYDPNKEVPDLIQNAFTLTLGYMGSAYINFTEK